MHTTVSKKDNLLQNDDFFDKNSIFDRGKVPIGIENVNFIKKYRFALQKLVSGLWMIFTKFNQFESDFFWFKPALTSLNQL